MNYYYYYFGGEIYYNIEEEKKVIEYIGTDKSNEFYKCIYLYVYTFSMFGIF